MTALVVFDSMYGNTERVARAIAASLGAEARRVDETAGSTLTDYSLLVVGSPTQGGRPTQAVRKFIDAIPAGSLSEVRVAAFDTRISGSNSGFALKTILRILGYAAGRINAGLVRKGAQSITPATGFIVDGREGPLHAGELERAAHWAQALEPLSTPAEK